MEENSILLRGQALERPAFSHESHGKRFDLLPLRVARLSGAWDTLNLLLPAELSAGVEPGAIADHYTALTEVTMEAAVSTVSDLMHPDANIIWGYSLDPEVGDSVRVTVIATGLTADYKDTRPVGGKATETTPEGQTVFPVDPWSDDDDDLMEINRIFEKRNADVAED